MYLNEQYETMKLYRPVLESNHFLMSLFHFLKVRSVYCLSCTFCVYGGGGVKSHSSPG